MDTVRYHALARCALARRTSRGLYEYTRHLIEHPTIENTSLKMALSCD